MDVFDKCTFDFDFSLITPLNDEKYKAITNPDPNASTKTTRVQEVKQALQKREMQIRLIQ